MRLASVPRVRAAPSALTRARDSTAPRRRAPPVRASGNADPAEPEPEVASVTYRGVPCEARVGSKLRSALLRAGLTPHNGRAKVINCRGLGTCGTCAVAIEGRVLPVRRTGTEEARLHFPPHAAPRSDDLRLACQVRVAADALVVRKRDGFWGQGERDLPDVDVGDARMDAAGAMPFGALEFALDPEEWTGVGAVEEAGDDGGRR